MTQVSLTVNGRPVTAEVDPRVHLADFLREHLRLTGTHLGCEHGVCGACTLLIDGEPARGCITVAALCDGADVRTIEGLDDDLAAARLRAAFSAEHALQCGYCTPGMLVTARDIVLRLPGATDDTVRLELAGNLCRCTGYNGIVRAIRRVLDENLALPPPARPAVPAASFGDAAPAAAVSTPAAALPDGLHPRLAFATPPATLWAALRDPALIATCIPGATLASVDGDRIAGAMVVTLGPVRARFAGGATLAYDDAALCGSIDGGGRDQAGGTMLAATAQFRVLPAGDGSVLEVDIDYTLRGPLAQLARKRVVDLLAGEIGAMFGTHLAARLGGQDVPQVAALSGLQLAVRMVMSWVRGLLSRNE